MKKIIFIIPPTVELLDLAGPVQVFTEAKYYGFEIEIEYYSYSPEPVSTSGLGFGPLRNYKEADLQAGDYIFVPGMDFDYINSISFGAETDFFDWLKVASQNNLTVCSVCTGAFALGKAGLLNGTECTTHWGRVADLQSQFPSARVLTDALHIKSNNIYSSAGISAGIDMALAILEDLKGPFFTYKIARVLVVYHRRSGYHKQQSIYLDYRNHINPQVHEVQDYIVNNLAGENNIHTLASMVNMSPRNLSRVFKDKTGSTILKYHTLLRKEYALTMLKNPEYTLELIASKCGFKSARQLQRILKSS